MFIFEAILVHGKKIGGPHHHENKARQISGHIRHCSLHGMVDHMQQSITRRAQADLFVETQFECFSLVTNLSLKHFEGK